MRAADHRHARAHRLWLLRWGRVEFARAELPPTHPAIAKTMTDFLRADALHDREGARCPALCS